MTRRYTLLWMVMAMTLAGGRPALLLAQNEPEAAAAPQVISLLDLIEKKSDEIQTYQSGLRYDQVQGLAGDQQTRFGAVYYVAGPPTRFAVYFQKLVVDGKLRDQERAWVFDGQWLVERLDDKKQFFKRQVVRPDQPMREDPLALDSGPFPIPLKVKKDAVLRRFVVAIVPVTNDDPADSVHLTLMPRPDSGIRFSWVHLWYDTRSLLPVKAHTMRQDTGDEQIFSLFKARLNDRIEDRYLDTAAPKARGWQVEITPWDKMQGQLPGGGQ